VTGATLFVVLASSLGWAALDALRKRLAGYLRPTALVAWLTLATLPLFLIWLAATGGGRPSWLYLGPGLAAVTLNVGANVLFMRALQVAPLSTTIPMLSFTPAFTAVLSALVLRELPGPRPLGGVALVVGGTLLLHGAPKATLDEGNRRGGWRDDGPRLMLMVAGLWSLVAVFDKAALAHATPALHGAFQCAGVGLAAFGLLVARGRTRELADVRAVRGTLLLAAVVSALALGLQFLAFQRTYVSSVEALKRTLGMLASLLSGRLFFGEPLGARKAAGVAGMAAGVTLILS
jgi:drug/metabolite transporter (DMT)-like permease